MSNLVIKIAGNSKAYARELKKVGKETQDLERQLGQITKVSSAAFLGFAGSIGAAVNEAAKFEKINAQFEVLTGNLQTANALVGELQDFSAKTPFKFEDVANAGKTLLSFGFDVDSIRGKLQEIGDVSAATGTPFKELAVIFGQVETAGKLTGERLNQLQEKAVPIGPELAKVLGIAETELRDAVSKGQVSAQDFQKAFANLSKEGGLAFKGLEKASETFSGKLSTLKDNFSLLLGEVGKQFLPLIKSLTDSITDLFNFIRTNPAFIDSAVQLLKWGAAITGGIAVIGGFGLAIIKVSAIITALTAAFAPAAVGASAFWAALTGPIGIAVIGIAAVTAAAFKLFDVFGDAKAKKAEETIEGIDNKLKDLTETQEKLQKQRSQGFPVSIEKVEGVEEEIKRLEELKVKRQEANEASGAKEKERDEKTKQKEEEKTAVVDAATKERIRLAKQERDLIKAEQEGASEEQLQFIQRSQDIENETIEAQKIKNNELRELELENIRSRNDQLLEEQSAFAERRREQEAEIREEDAELAAELEELKKEARTEKEQEDLANLQNQLLTRREAEKQVENERIQERIKTRNEELKNEAKFGTAFAKINTAFNNEQVKGARSAAGQLVALQQSKNNTLKGIGKAAAVTQIGIDTGKGAIAAYSSLAGIPLIGPALGAAAAAALIAFGAEQLGTVLAANKGGRVPGNIPGAIPGVDSVNARLTPGEFVVPDRNFDEVVNSVAASRNGESVGTSESTSQGGSSNEIIISGDIIDNDQFVEDLTDKIREKVLFENFDIGVR